MKKETLFTRQDLTIHPGGMVPLSASIDANGSVNTKRAEWPCRQTAEGIPHNCPPDTHTISASRLIGALMHAVSTFLADELF